MSRRIKKYGDLIMGESLTAFPDLEDSLMDTPEKKMWCSVLLYAIYDYYSEGRENLPPYSVYRKGYYQELNAREFFFGENSSFEEIADAISPDGHDLASIIRKFLRTTKYLKKPQADDKPRRPRITKNFVTKGSRK